jgi:hypothetical protein
MRLVILGFFLFLILFVGILFWPIILNEIITPIALTVWLLLRIFVLSIDQKYYWGGITFVVLVFLYRLLLHDQTTVQIDDYKEENATIRTVSYWRSLFNLTGDDIREEKNLKRELIRLLLSLYATKHRTAADFGLYEALQRGEIPLPEHIRAFLFSEEPQETKRSFIKLIESVRSAPQKWAFRLTGQETAERYRMIDEVLSFMETGLEMKNDDGKFNPN